MTDQTIKRKGGRPPLPPAPQNAGDCRTLIAAETVKSAPRERTLRALYKLLKAFERAAAQQATDERNRLLADQNRIQAELLALQTAEHRRRFVTMPLGQQQLLKQVDSLKARVKRLELEVAGAAKAEVGVESVARRNGGEQHHGSQSRNTSETQQEVHAQGGEGTPKTCGCDGRITARTFRQAIEVCGCSD